jgi:uncharacterized protein YgbK (DUF1537 family)
VSGSCSQATNRQVARFIAAGGAAYAIDAMRAATDSESAVAQALEWAEARLDTNARDPLLIYSTAEPDAVRQIQASLGAEHASTAIERTLASIASGLVHHGVRQLIVAGGETAGACVQALGISQLRIGLQIDTGVPWCFAERDAGQGGIHLALKSGNFGSDDFFHKAFTMLQ